MPPLWDYCMWSVCCDMYSMAILEQPGVCVNVPVCCVCSQIVAPVLNYEKQQPRATLNFHKTITASWIQVAHPVVTQTKRDGGTDRGTEKKEWQISRAQINRRCDTAMERPCYVGSALATTVLMCCHAKMIHTNESAACSSKTVFRSYQNYTVKHEKVPSSFSQSKQYFRSQDGGCEASFSPPL